MTATTLLDHLAEQRDDYLRQIDALSMVVENREEPMTDQERENFGFLRGRVERITGDMDAASVTVDVTNRTRDALARARLGSQAPTDHVYRDATQATWDVLNRANDQAARFRFETVLSRQMTPAFRAVHDREVPLFELVMQRAAEHMGLVAANTVAPAGGFDGLIVDPIYGPIVDLNWVDTPLTTLLGRRLPPSRSFRRVRLVDPDFYTVADTAAGGKEKAEFPSKKWDYVSETVALGQPIGNYINLSLLAEEEVSTAVAEVTSHLRLRTEVGVETRTVAEVAKTTNKVTLASTADAVAFQKAIWDAMAAVFLATKRPATWLAYGPLGMAMIGAKTDLAGRPLFPSTPVVNGLGTANAGTFTVISPFGLTAALSPAIADTTIYIGNSIGLEIYVKPLPILQVPEPSVAGRQIGCYTGIGFYHPITAEATTGTGATPAARNGIVKIAP